MFQAPKITAYIPLRIFLVILFTLTVAEAYNTDVCCNLAKKSQSFLGTEVPPIQNQTCGQSFGEGIPAALPLYVDYAFCSSKCGGMGLSKLSKPKEWAAPIVQFLLPSVIFSISIPREHVIDIDYTQILMAKWKIKNGFIQMLVSVTFFWLVLLPVVVDSVLWIIYVVVGAGNMIIGGLFEAVIDYRIVKYVKSLADEKLAVKRELLATLASGNLRLSPPSPLDPKTEILNSLQPLESDFEKTRSRLLSLIGAQSGFGGVVGSPVLFYLGAFVYNIIDLQNDPSDQDNAISLGFGIEWMIIVHVAIVSGTLLAANNPSTSSAIVGSDHAAMVRSRVPGGNQSPDREGWAEWLGWSRSYETKFQPVSIWSRGANKMKWIQDTEAWRNNETSSAFRELMHFSFWSWVGIFTLASLLIVIPPASGGVVAWATPPRGIACRSLSFILYGGSQLFTTFLATLQAARPNDYWLQGPRFLFLSAPFWFFSFVAAIGGTVMQISGVYRNCICYAGSESWRNVKAKNPLIQVANDTEAARTASKYWIWMGIFATIFMALNCYIGWWYQMFIRKRFTEVVEHMVHPPVANTGHQVAADADHDAFYPEVAGGIDPEADQQLVNQVPARQSSFGLPHPSRDGYSFEMEFMAMRFSEEENRLLLPIEVPTDESRRSVSSFQHSADTERT